MILFKDASSLHQYLQKKKKKGLTIGFVPTMGALHEGHRKLVLQSCEETDCTVVSIFVNPTQFNDPVDFEKYPSGIEEDIRLLATTRVHILFLPSVKEMYPHGISGLEQYDLGFLETILEGKFRPGHFQGVCQVMCRLLKIVNPSLLFMGQKDYQQCLVIRKLIELMELRAQLIIAPTIRENDGLAMSSRNRRLNTESRKKASHIYKALEYLRKNWQKEGMHAKAVATTLLEENNFRMDYVEVADAETLELLQQPAEKAQVALVAVFLDDVRLIDNLLL
jgi:pantoate--beta-alanine ligase